MKINFLFCLCLVFICCSNENSGDVSNGTVVDENSIANSDSLAQILQTWEPAIPVDFGEWQLNNSYGDVSGNQSLFEFVFCSDVENIYEHYSEDGVEACTIQLYKQQNSLLFTLRDIQKKSKYVQVLKLVEKTQIKEEYINVLYSNEMLFSRTVDSLQFADGCLKKNGHVKFYKGLNSELNLKCESVVNSLVAAQDYLLDNVEVLKNFCK